mmetsp:Transcript_138043/g.195365  ORF Transcript_138043/g.195365 Transcript_138043/m.195365 type:complete len:201 (-) Transcript_138043:57-659(-)
MTDMEVAVPYADASVPVITVTLQRIGQLLIQALELRDVHFLEAVTGAELVDLVVDLVEDPRLVVVWAVELDGVVRLCGIQAVHHFNLVEVDDAATAGTAWDLSHCVCLESDLNELHPMDKRQWQHGSTEGRGVLTASQTGASNGSQGLWSRLAVPLPSSTHPHVPLEPSEGQTTLLMPRSVTGLIPGGWWRRREGHPVLQ